MKLSHWFNKPSESFVELIKAHPYKKCWQLSKIVKESSIQDNVPESISVVIETEPSTLIESKV